MDARIAALGVGALILSATVLVPQSAFAAEMTVTSAVDGEPGSLRNLVEQANTEPGAHTITIPAGMTVRLSGAEIEVTGDLTVVGAATRPTIYSEPDFDPNSALLRVVPGGSLNISQVNLDGASLRMTGIQGEYGAGEVHVADMDIRQAGTGIELGDVSAPTTIERVRFFGGWDGLRLAFVSGSSGFTVRDSTFTGLSNRAIYLGGIGPDADAGVVLVGNTFHDTGSGYQGDRVVMVAGIDAGRLGSAPALDIRDSLIEGTLMDQDLGSVIAIGDIYQYPAGSNTPTVRIANTTVVRTGNVAVISAQTREASDRIRIENTTILGPTSSPVLFNMAPHDDPDYITVLDIDHSTIQGTLHSDANERLRVNLDSTVIDSGTAPTFNAPLERTAVASVLTVADPELAGGTRVVAPENLGLLPPAPGPNGLPVRMLSPDSPLLDGGTETSVLPVDQRGKARVSGPASDVGAVEMQYGAISVADAGDVPAGTDAAFAVSVTTPGELPITAEVGTRAATAQADIDFTASERTLTWAAEDPEPQDVDVPTLVRAGNHGTTFDLVLGTVTGASVVRPVGTARIVETPTPTPTGPTPTGEASVGPPTPSAGPSDPATAGGHGSLGQTGLPDGTLWGVGGAAMLLMLAGAGALLRRRGGVTGRR
ncbi:hypothetical protein D9V34_12185 [Mycetocola lacteus]|uniref:Right handed beta helix domain-containing protein n=1 Tax=Mycetocola lacteus TaxID=76637 RepID=A0A3L7AM60_9MICO|nr:right-handed parallel beta-helix repeat-containing protein [Mycetocola lacteus]RLP81377.1 hypothetical protein D9V34_12185 [Mycetocola lacteus]